MFHYSLSYNFNLRKNYQRKYINVLYKNVSSKANEPNLTKLIVIKK